MTATTRLAMGKRIGLSVLIASLAPTILAQSNCDSDSDSDSNSDSDSDSDGGHNTGNTSQHSSSTTSARTSSCIHTGSHTRSHTGTGTTPSVSPPSGGGGVSGVSPASRTGTLSSSGALVSSSSSSVQQSNHNLTEDKHLGGGAIAGTIIGILAALFLVALLACFLRRRRRRQMYLADKSALRTRGGLLAVTEDDNTSGHDHNANLESGKDLPANPQHGQDQDQERQQQQTFRNIGHDNRNTMLSMTEQGSTLLSYVPSGPPTSSTPSYSSVSNPGHDRYAIPPCLRPGVIPESIVNVPEMTSAHDALASHQKELEASFYSGGQDSELQPGSHLYNPVDPPPQYKEML